MSSPKGQIILGEFGKLCARQSSQERLEIGELVVSDSAEHMLLQVYDLLYGSQISAQNIELIAGLRLEDNADVELFDESLRMYGMALLKPVLVLGKGTLPKTMPPIFTNIRAVTADDLAFLSKPDNALRIGNLRSGSTILDSPVYVPGKDVLSHHILISATTGRGKSNLVKNLLWDAADKQYCGVLVLDPHDEYYGRDGIGLKAKGASYYTTANPPPGTRTLRIHLSVLRPGHFTGVSDWSSAQMEALYAYYKKFGKQWIEHIIRGVPLDGFSDGTLAVLRRRMTSLLSIRLSHDKLACSGVFSADSGETTIGDIVSELEQARTVIIDTSLFDGRIEVLIGSLIAGEVLRRYKNYKMQGSLSNKPVISIVLEEAPRVLGKEVLEKGSNIFATIAREGRKFKVGLCAITQLPSLIPRQVLANMNTKIIMGTEMAPERHALIESAAQDLSQDDRNIASLDRGEAIVTSTFTRFAMPIKVPLFDDTAGSEKKAAKLGFSGIKTE